MQNKSEIEEKIMKHLINLLINHMEKNSLLNGLKPLATLIEEA